MVPPLDPAVVFMLDATDEPLQPLGNVHVYDVAPDTGVTEYEFEVVAHTDAGPEITPGVAGAARITTAFVCAGELPQVLSAVTDIVPPFAPAVTFIVSVVDVPLHPLGKVHV